MNVTHISHFDNFGGAAKAAFRLHCTLRDAGHSSHMLVQKKQSGNIFVREPQGYFRKTVSLARIFTGELIAKLQKSKKHVLHTPSWLSFGGERFINQLDTDVVNLHMLRDIPSIAEIGYIKKPVVWTLHDMWAFCGAEHITSYNDNARWRTGYSNEKKSASTQRLDINRWVWRRKKRHWKRPLHIITPSNWLAKCVSESALMHSWPTHVIPNVLNTNIFKPLDKSYARHVFGFPQDQKIILFGAIMGGEDPNKGFDLLQNALESLPATKKKGYTCVVFGQEKPEVSPTIGMPIQWMGHLSDEWSLALLYNAADVMVVPSHQETFGQTASEALTCGCPTVAFNSTGLKDVVVHEKTGYLARSFESEDLAYGIQWVLEDKERYERLSVASRKRAVSLWAPEVVLPQYLEVYQQAIEQQARK